jgi:Phosphoesterase family
MPYPGYRGYCFPVKCNGIPDSDTQYVAKHNGIVNFKDMQTPSELAKMNPYNQLARDLASGQVPNFSYIVPDECHDMHGAPPWCVDSGKAGSSEEIPLEAAGDAFAGKTVNAITSSAVWQSGNNAIVITFDEGNFATDTVPTIVITNLSRGVRRGRRSGSRGWCRASGCGRQRRHASRLGRRDSSVEPKGFRSAKYTVSEAKLR